MLSFVVNPAGQLPAADVPDVASRHWAYAYSLCEVQNAQLNNLDLLLQVSATNIATVIWHGQWKVPFQYVSVDKDLLAARGYALERDLRLVGELQPSMLKKSEDYGIHSQEVEVACTCCPYASARQIAL